MSRFRFKVPRVSGTQASILLILTLGLKWLLMRQDGFPNDLIHSLNLILIVMSLILIVILIVQTFNDLIAVLKRASAGVSYLIKSFCGIKSAKAPEIYVRDLFDAYAEKFDAHLVTTLGYQVPQQMLNIVQQSITTPKTFKILDLGCGTGLCAVALKPITDSIVGIDLSAPMLEKADERQLYDALICNSLIKAHQYYQQEFNLVVSADVLIYFGDLTEVFEVVLQVLEEKGYFIFSLEESQGEPWIVKKNGRYAHNRNYVITQAQRFKLTVVTISKQTQRFEDGKPVIGDIYLLQRNSISPQLTA